MHLFISNLSYLATDEDVLKLFSTFGTVSSAKVVMNKKINRSRGFGYIEMPNDDEGEKALTSLNHKNIKGRVLHVARAAKPYDPNPLERD